MDSIVDATFRDILHRYPEKTIDRDSAWSAIRSVMNQAETRRVKFLAHSASSQEDSPAKGLLEEYGQEILERLNPGFLLVVYQNVIKPIVRPELLEVYRYEDRTYVAISERQLITGQDETIIKIELRHFSCLPKPSRNVEIDTVCGDWNCSMPTVEHFMKENFLVREHREQVDVFQEKQFNFLFYDNLGYFTHSHPRATEVPNFVVRKPCLFSKDNIEVFDDEDDDDSF